MLYVIDRYSLLFFFFFFTANICQETTVHIASNSFTFPETVIGQASYSKEHCTQESINGKVSQQTAKINNMNNQLIKNKNTGYLVKVEFLFILSVYCFKNVYCLF